MFACIFRIIRLQVALVIGACSSCLQHLQDAPGVVGERQVSGFYNAPRGAMVVDSKLQKFSSTPYIFVSAATPNCFSSRL